MAEKEKLYKRIKIAGMLSLIPLILSCSLFAGYYLGSWLKTKFGLSFWVVFVCIMLGLLIAVREIAKIIRIALKISAKLGD